MHVLASNGTAVGILDQKTGPGGDRMFSTEQRRIAIETFIKFDHSYADTEAELGYPTTDR